MTEIRYTQEGDGAYLLDWLRDPAIIRWFPMMNTSPELDDAVRHWIGYWRYGSSLTAVDDEIPCGICTINLMPYRKMMHQGLISIIVEEGHRGKGIGTMLLNNILALAIDRFHMTHLYLEVYEGNPAINLYRRFGFKEVGSQDHFLREADGTYVKKIIMERALS